MSTNRSVILDRDNVEISAANTRTESSPAIAVGVPTLVIAAAPI